MHIQFLNAFRNPGQISWAIQTNLGIWAIQLYSTADCAVVHLNAVLYSLYGPGALSC
jgi:hypothetical protein